MEIDITNACSDQYAKELPVNMLRNFNWWNSCVDFFLKFGKPEQYAFVKLRDYQLCILSFCKSYYIWNDQVDYEWLGGSECSYKQFWECIFFDSWLWNSVD